MTESQSRDEIRRLLADLEGRSSMGNPPRTKAFSVDEITEAGGDVDVVRAWVEDHGGEEMIVQLDDNSLGAGLVRKPPTQVPFMWVPLSALRS